LLVPVFLFCALGGTFAFAKDITLVLKEEVSAQKAVVCLGDVADVQARPGLGLDPALIELGTAPEFGSVRNFSRSQIQESVAAVLGPSAEVGFEGAQAVKVKRQGRPADPSEISAAIKSYILKVTTWTGPEVEVSLTGNPADVEIPIGDVDLVIPQRNSPVSFQNIAFRLEAMRAGKVMRSFWVTADVHIRAKVLQAARQIPFGGILAVEDLQEATTEITDPRVIYFRKLEEVVGNEVKRPLSTGDPITRDVVTSPVLVRSGDMVQLRLIRSGVSLTTSARAEQNGKLGQLIRIRNLEFSRPIKAMVTARGEVMVH
jgi:flagellar basal body P-ring formation protein FlgA